jgi:hypothetical protein
MTLTPSVRAISLCSIPCLAKSFACASFVATSTRECRFTLAMATCPAAATSIGFAAQGSIAVFWTSPTNRRRARCTEKPKFPARQVSDLRRGPKNNGVLEEQPVTIVTSSEPRSVERCLGGRYGSTDGFPVAAEAGRSSWGLPAPCEDAAICASMRTRPPPQTKCHSIPRRSGWDKYPIWIQGSQSRAGKRLRPCPPLRGRVRGYAPDPVRRKRKKIKFKEINLFSFFLFSLRFVDWFVGTARASAKS